MEFQDGNFAYFVQYLEESSEPVGIWECQEDNSKEGAYSAIQHCWANFAQRLRSPCWKQKQTVKLRNKVKTAGK